MLLRQVLAVAPYALRIAAALSERPGLVALLDGVGAGWNPGGRWSFVTCDPDARSTELDPHRDADPAAVGDPLAGIVPRWIGVVPYEARRAGLERPGWTGPDGRSAPALLEISWRRYPAVVAIDHRAGQVLCIGTREAEVRALAAAVERGGHEVTAPPVAVQDDEPPTRHVERVRAALELIRAGDIYQVNLARRLLLDLGRELDPAVAIALARRLLTASPSPFGAVLCDDAAIAISTSPELLLDARVGTGGARFDALRTDPIKGTRPRAPGGARELDADPKERAELAMIIDVERNDLGRVARIGSVEVVAPRVVRAGRVLHRVASVRAQARPGLSGAEVLSSIVPSGSVTGAPKVRAMEVIASLEPVRRGLYTGGLGMVAHDGSVRLAMAIRTAVFPAGGAGRGEWLVGGGIVEASDPDRELEETSWKSRQLASLAGEGTDVG